MESYPYKNYKIVDADQLNADLTSVADAIRIKGKTTASLDFPDGFVGAIDNIKTGDDAPVAEKDVNFYDYDGTLLHSYTVAEAQALTELPELPEREGLICQGWNWTLEDIKDHNRAIDVYATYTTDDGTTRIYINLHEGRTSPMLGCSPKGTVTVDWGDGTTPDVLAGTSTSTVKWTPTHNYDKPGNYIITLSVDGEMELSGQYGLGTNILRHSNADTAINKAYQASVLRVELGNNVTRIGSQAFNSCYNLAAISIPNSVTYIGGSAFVDCKSLRSVVIPNSVTDLFLQTFEMCVSLTSIVIPNSIKSIGKNAFNCCYSMFIYDFTKHTAVPTASGNLFNTTSSDFKILVPAALYDEWIAATNWATYASQIVAV